MKFIGYHHESTLPIKKGDKVRIPKGVEVKSREGVKISGRPQTVDVNHVLPGVSANVGILTKGLEPGGADHWSWQIRVRDLEDLMRQLGLPCGNNLDFEVSRQVILIRARENLIPCTGDSDCRSFYGRVHVSNPMVRWAGSNGYWRSVDINDLI